MRIYIYIYIYPHTRIRICPEELSLAACAPGSGQTEVIGLLALAVLQQRLFSHVVILSNAIDLEEQAMQRLKPFFARFHVPFKRAEHQAMYTKG